MATDSSHQQERGFSRRDFITTGVGAGAAAYLAAAGSASAATPSAKGGQKVMLNNLFQQQAGYSASDLAGMTKMFEKANPNIKVNNTLVAYEALHDKIVSAAPAGTYDVVLGDVIWPAEFGSRGIVKNINSLVNTLPINKIFPGALVMARYKGTFYGMPWLLDTKYMYANGKMLKQAGVNPAQLRRGTVSSRRLRRSRARASSSTPGSAAGIRPRRLSATTPSCSAPSVASSSTPPGSQRSRPAAA